MFNRQVPGSSEVEYRVYTMQWQEISVGINKCKCADLGGRGPGEGWNESYGAQVFLILKLENITLFPYMLILLEVIKIILNLTVKNLRGFLKEIKMLTLQLI